MQVEFIKSPEDGSTQIKRDGLLLVCPFVPPFVVPAQSSVISERALQIVKTPCSSNCPHFTKARAEVAHGKADAVIISCGSEKRLITETN